MKKELFTDFSALYEYCKRRYPELIVENLDVLYRRVWVPPAGIKNWSKIKRIRWNLGCRYYLQSEYFKTFFRKSLLKIQAEDKCSVLVPFIYCRRDQQAFIYPVLNILKQKGIKAVVFTCFNDFKTKMNPEFFKGIPFIFSENCWTDSSYKNADKLYCSLKPFIKQFCNDLGLDSLQSQRTDHFFKKYAWDKEVFALALRMTKPLLIYGIHYIAAPGYLSAIDEFKQNYRLKNILIQHGPFPKGEFHDFKGADHVLLWGEYYQNILNSITSVPVPPSTVAGNPKMEIELSSWQNPSEENNIPSADILFASTPDTTLTGHQNRASIELFAGVMKNYYTKYNVIYKVHPAENMENYNEFVQKGIIRPEQIIKNISIYQLIKKSKVVAGTVTAVLPEAMSMGKPVIQLLLPCLPTDWYKYGVTSASTENELNEKINLILNSSDYKKKVLDSQQRLLSLMFGEIKGSSGKIADSLLSLI